MNYSSSSVFVCFLTTFCFLTINAKYLPTWESLDARPLPGWYDEAKIGIFIHWGVFSVPSWGNLHSGTAGEWFWWNWKGAKNPNYDKFMEQNYPPGFTYADFAAQFRAEFYDPDQWADIFKASGAKYVVLTSKHHEGFTNWPSNVSWNWNSMDVGPHRDLVGDLATSLRKQDLHVGLYHSLFEWFNPIYLQDKSSGFKTQKFVMEKTGPELYDIVMRYRPDLIWSDGQWEAPSTYWNSTHFLAWLYNESPVKDTIVVNDRWGKETSCAHGGYYSCNDRYNPGVLQKHKWENAMTIDKYSWGYRRNAVLSDHLTITEILRTLAQTVSCGGNILINIGPTHDGRIQPLFEERLRQLGEWLDVNGEAIYGTTTWNTAQNDSITPDIWYTFRKHPHSNNTVYAIMFNYPTSSNLTLEVMPYAGVAVTMLGYPQGGYFNWQRHEFRPGGIEIEFPVIPADKLPCKWAWVLKITGVIM